MITLGALCLAFFAASSCAIDHRSGEFECATQADCTGGRTCVDGYCVVPGGVIDAPPVDGPRQPVDMRLEPDAPMPQCPPQCTSCQAESHTCKIDCAQTNCANTTLVCPTGWNCDISCSTNNSCRNGINCANAESCKITCSGQGSCRQVVSGDGPLEVACTGQGSCRGINCDASCACDVTCNDAADCSLLTCSSPVCGVLGGGCTSDRTSCESCP
ncbi:MAG TPA: hypothetical protein VM513_23635 [Kofleriaceae bacterium]|nr:hypothetical protein [Kofleriaceae bacterium]